MEILKNLCRNSSFLIEIFSFIIIINLIFICNAGSTVKISCSSIAPKGSLFEKILQEASIKIKQETEVEIVWIPGQVFGDEIDIARALKEKKIDCAVLTVNGLRIIIPYFSVLDMPYLVKNYEEGDFIRKEVLPPLLSKLLENEDYILGGLVEIGFVYFYSKYPLRRIQDFSGKTFWVWPKNIIQEGTFNQLKKFGVKPVYANIWDVEKLSSNIDIVWGPHYAVLIYGWYKYFQFIVEEPLIYFMAGVLIRKDTMKKFSKDTQEKVINIIRDFSDKASYLIREENKRTENYLLGNHKYQKVKFEDSENLEKILKDALWQELKTKYSLPEWLFLSLIKEVIKFRLNIKK
jgi:TRAP-type C4-dicarboxylate transport system substrate-binding protein